MTPRLGAALAVALLLAPIPAQAREGPKCVRFWSDEYAHNRYLPLYPNLELFDFVAWTCEMDRAQVLVIACDEWRRVTQPPAPNETNNPLPDECR